MLIESPTCEFATAFDMQYIQHLTDEWQDAGKVSRFVCRSKRHTARMLVDLHARGLISCKIDLNFPRARKLWRLKPEG